MRRLAERVGVKAASLYNHVRDKDELLTLVADAICAEVVAPDPAAELRTQLETYGRRFRDVLLAHRDAARVLAATPPLGDHRLRLIEQVLDLLCRLGLDDATAAAAAAVVNSYVVGFVLDETLPAAAGDAAAIERVRTDFKSLPRGRFPRLVALADHLVDTPPGKRFELGLALLLDGLAQPARPSVARARTSS
jgi:TetR/AcrR family transcriptional regulator, tetracycline repressor protein